MATTALAVIEQKIRGNEVMAKISASMGKPATDPSVMKFINGAIMEIQNKVGTKGDVTRCSQQSIINSLINAALVRLPVDNRKLAHLVPFGDACTFMPDYKGYIYKVKEADPSVEATVAIVYKGDTFTFSREDGSATYKHNSINAFEDDPKNIVGIYCYLKSDSGSWIEVMSHKELMKVKAQSKMVSGAIWSTWELEMLKKSMVRRALKIKFNEAIADLDALDNKLFNERPEKIAPVLASDAAPLPDEKIEEAEVVEGDKKEPEKKAPEAAAAGEGKTETTGDIETIIGGIEKYYAPKKETSPHSWKINGAFFQIFAKDKDGTDNSAIIKTMGDMEQSMKNVKVLYRKGSYVSGGVTVPVNTIVNAYPDENK